MIVEGIELKLLMVKGCEWNRASNVSERAQLRASILGHAASRLAHPPSHLRHRHKANF